MRAKEAKKILPKNEFEAFEAILMNQTGKLNRSRLMQKATLARRLRDKYRDLAHREVYETRTRRTNEVDTDINDRRVRLLQELIDRLEQSIDTAPPASELSKQRLRRRNLAYAEANELSANDRKAMLAARRLSRKIG